MIGTPVVSFVFLLVYNERHCRSSCALAVAVALVVVVVVVVEEEEECALFYIYIRDAAKDCKHKHPGTGDSCVVAIQYVPRTFFLHHLSPML